MTCIVAFKTVEGHTVLAGDFMASNGHSFRKVRSAKIFKKAENCAIGYTDSFRMGQILEHVWSMPDRSVNCDDEEYLYINIVESLRTTFSALNYGTKGAKEEYFGSFLLVYKDRIFEVQGNMSMLEFVEDMCAVGSGQDAALGAMMALGTPTLDQVEGYLEQVFMATNFVTHTVSTEFAFTVIETDNPTDLTVGVPEQEEPSVLPDGDTLIYVTDNHSLENYNVVQCSSPVTASNGEGAAKSAGRNKNPRKYYNG